jgi:hypothetical protein
MLRTVCYAAAIAMRALGPVVRVAGIHLPFLFEFFDDSLSTVRAEEVGLVDVDVSAGCGVVEP